MMVYFPAKKCSRMSSYCIEVSRFIPPRVNGHLAPLALAVPRRF